MNTSENQSLNPKCKYHVLIVEDDVCLKTILGRVLGSIDPNVSYTWATSAEDAKKILAEMKVSLIIADFALFGEETGLDLWKHCKELFPSLPFLMISGLGVERFLELVARDRITPPFLPKPFRVGECQQILKALLENNRRRPSV